MPGSVKLAISSGILIFAIGAIFWAGATYNQIGDIEKQLTVVDMKLGTLQTVPVLQRDVDEHERRLQKVEDQIRQLK